MHKLQILPLDEECVICFYPLQKEKIALVECGHLYHYRCLKEWLNVSKDQRCPTCRVGRRMTKLQGKRKNTHCCCFWL